MTTGKLATRKLGRTGIAVTEIGFGGAPLGGFRGAISEQQASRTIEAAWDSGQRYFDTAPFYGYGRSELRFGLVLRDRPRDSFVLSTKVGRVIEPFDRCDPPPGMRTGGLPFAARFDYSAAGAERSLEQSTMRLGIPEIDIVYIHDIDVFTHGTRAAAERRFEEAMSGCYPYLCALRDRGQVKAIGVGLNETEMSLRFAREADIDCILLAGRYTLLEQGALAELLPICEQKGIAVVLGGPFNSGVLATGLSSDARYDYGDVPDAIADRVTAITAICRKHNVDLRAAALQFPLAHSAITSVIPGAMSAQEVMDNMEVLARPIPTAFWIELVERGLIDDDAPLPDRTGMPDG